MSEQIEDKGDNTPAHQEREYTAIELEAMEQGWRPKEEFEGDESRFIEAGEFVRRGELFAKIDHQNKELKQVKNALEQFKLHHANVEKATYDRAIKDLKAQRKAALAEGDVDLFDKLDNDIDEVSQARDDFVQNQAKAPAVQEVNPEFSAWVSKNSWYTKDAVMTGAADTLGRQLAAQGLTPLEVLKQVEIQIKKEFPHKFSNPNREKAPSVESPSPRGGGNKSKFVPTEEQKRIGASFVRAGAFKTPDEYYAELEKMEKGN